MRKRKKKKKLPEIDFKQLEEEKKRNYGQRMAFIDYYVDWIRRTPDETVSRTYKKFINSLYRNKKVGPPQITQKNYGRSLQ